MMRTAAFVSAISTVALQGAMAPQAVMADEVHRNMFTGALIGTWAQSADLCTKGDKSNFSIAASTYTGPDGSCDVQTIVEMASPKGTRYSVRGRCAATPQDQPRFISTLMQPDGADAMSIGSSFEDLKPYQRCPAK
jgi:hypothetical protein